MVGPSSPSKDTHEVIPMDNISTFLSYNSTGLNSVKTKWIRDIVKLTKSDYISIQEHFKKTKTIDKYFIDQFLTNLHLLFLAIVKVDKTLADQKEGLPCSVEKVKVLARKG